MTSIRAAILTALLIVPVEGTAQGLRLQLVPSSLSPSACPGELFRVSVQLENPAALEVGGYQVFLRFPAEYFEAVRYEGKEIEEYLQAGGREPFGQGYAPCAENVADAWGDLAGEDIVSVVGSVFGSSQPEPFTETSAELGQFVFRIRGKLTEGTGVTFRSNEEVCTLPLDQSSRVFGLGGQDLSAEPIAPFTVEVKESGSFVTSFLCGDSGDSVTLTWVEPLGPGISGYKIYRDGTPIATYPIRAVSRHIDRSPPQGTVRYEIAVLKQGGVEGCRDSCSIERQTRFIRGDANRDNTLSITDAVAILAHLFQSGSIACQDAADADDDGKVLLTDAVRVLGHLFKGQPALPAPFPAPGSDPTPDLLGCGP